MKHLLLSLLAATALFAFPATARSEMTPEQFVGLAEAYQSGYLQLLAASAVQVYSTAGLVATEFSAGKRSGPDAADALEDTLLLHGVAYATLLQVQKATPKDDRQSHAEIGKLAAVLVAEKDLLLAIQDVFSNPTPKNAARVDTAKDNVGKLLEKLGE